MHPKALLDACAELVAQVLTFEHPADAVVSRYFREHRQLGPRERATLAETAYAVLRKKPLLEYLARSGSGPRERRLAILGFAQALDEQERERTGRPDARGSRDFLKGALTESERLWLDQCDAAREEDLLAPHRHNLPDWLVAPLKAQLGGYNAVEIFRGHAARGQTDDPLSLVQYLDLKTYLVGDINTKVDRASMAHALEVREPLMDHPLVEWLATLPTHMKVRGDEGKWLLKKSMESYLPHDVLYRPKQGFAVPLARWFRGPLKARVREALLGEVMADTGWFDRPTLQRLLAEHESGLRDHSAPLWTLLMFDAFLRNVAGAAPVRDSRKAG